MASWWRWIWQWNDKEESKESGDLKESKKYVCVCTCYHANDLPQYNCVIFVRQNYNLNIPVVANVLSKWYREIIQKEFMCKPCHKELKDGKYSKNVQNCPNSDMFGSKKNHDEDSQGNVQECRTDDINNIMWFFHKLYNPEYCIDRLLCTCSIKLIYQDCSISYSKNQSTILTLPLL